MAATRLPRSLHSPRWRRSALPSFAALLVAAAGRAQRAAVAQLRGHGGPVRALAISADGQTAISGSFDSTAIRWSLTRNAAEQVLRFHADAVNAVVLLGDGRAATAGADGRIAIWTSGKTEPDAVLEGHTAPIVALAVSPDGATLASASWDHTVRLWPLAGGAPRVLDGHTQNVNGVAFTADGRTLVSVSYDLSVRIWPLSGAQTPTVVAMPTPLNAVAVGRRRRNRGRRRRRQGLFPDRRAGAPAGEVAAGPRPVISIAISPDGALVAAAGIGGIGRGDRSQDAHARAHAGRSGPAGLVGRVPARQPHAAHRRRRQHHPPLERGDRRAGRSASAGDGGRSARRLCRRSRRGNLSRLCRLPHAWRRPGQPGRPDACRHLRPAHRHRCRVTIFPKRSSASISSGRRRRFPNCSRSDRRPTRPAPRCRSSASVRNRTAPRWCNSSSARRSDRCAMNRRRPVQPTHIQSH